MKKQFFTLLLFALAAYGQQQKRIAIVNTEDDGEPPIRNSELTHLTDKLREIANKTLPKKNYAVMTQQSIVAFLGSQESMIKECKAAEGCLAKLGRKINADYVGQARIGRFGKDLTIKVELYESGSGNLITSFTGMSKDIYGLLSVLNENAPALFKQMPGVPTPTPTPVLAPVQLVVTEYGQQLTDSRDGKKYKAVIIGKQTWMAENLNYNASGSRCYDNNIAYCDKYGRLYDWETAIKVCPKGWHLPSKPEWEILTAAVGGEKTEGKYLKAADDWNKDGEGEDKFGFAALPGGCSELSGNYFENAGYFGYWWSSSGNSRYAYARSMYCLYDYAYWKGYPTHAFFSVRCVKDK